MAEVRDATLTPVRRDHLRASGAASPRYWMVGAAYDSSGRLVRESQRVWRGDPNAPVAADPERIRLLRPRAVLEGRWLYAGHWMHHFGHFLLETVTSLWPRPDEQPAGIVAHRSFRAKPPARGGGVLRPRLREWQREMLSLAGFADVDVRLVSQRPARVETLVVPVRPVVLKSWALPEAAAVWRRISDAVGDRGPDSRVFLSRSRFHAGRREERARVRVPVEWDRLLDSAFAAAGFAVVHPEELTLSQQVAIVRGADVLAGASGSALHLAAFARPGTRVLEIGDTRNPTWPMPTQRMVDAACGHRSAFVAFDDEPGLRAALATL